MELEQWRNEGCVANFGVGDDWATLYDISTDIKQRRKGLATVLLAEAKNHYEGLGKKFGGTVALNPTMKGFYERLKIKEYSEEV